MKRDGSIKRAELVRAREYHVRQIARIDEELSRTPGSVSTRRVTSNTRKWLEGLNTIRLRAQAEKVGLAPDEYDEIDGLIGAILERMGLNGA
jgi:hypothetical protein